MMESFFLGETLKYLYLLMADKQEIDLSQWVSALFLIGCYFSEGQSFSVQVKSALNSESKQNFP